MNIIIAYSIKWQEDMYLIAAFLLFFFASPSLAHDSPNSIHMTSQGFEPNHIEINVGDTVMFENLDEKERWPASNIHPSHEIYPEFDSLKPINPGQSWSFMFEKPGEWQFHDHLFPNFSGSISVKGDSQQIEKRQSENISDKLNDLSEVLKIKIYKAYYSIRPKRAEKRLSSLKLPGLQRNDSTPLFWIKVFGPEKIMDQLLKETNGGTTLDCHNQAHIIGRLSFIALGKQTFQKGDPACHSGFYHGAMEAFLSTNGTVNLSENIESICNEFPTYFGIFECLHGVGHGVMAYENYNLPNAIATCNSLSDSFTKSSCLGGVFMENIVTAQGNPSQEGHTTSWISEDSHFPCNAVDQSFEVQHQCYLMQTSRMLQLYGWDIEKTSESCLSAKEEFVSTCFQSLGRDIAGMTLRNQRSIITECSKTPQEYRQICITGGLNVIVDFWGDKMSNQPAELCNLIDDPNDLSECINILSARIIDVFGKNPEKANEICSYLTKEKDYCTVKTTEYIKAL